MPTSDPFYQREKEKYGNPIPSREFILDVLQSKGPLNLRQLIEVLDVAGDEAFTAVKRRIRAMERDGQVIFDKKKRYDIPSPTQLVTGTVLAHRDGYGFLKLDSGGEDWFIPVGQMNTLFHGDKVTALQDGLGFRGKPEARIVRVLTESPPNLVGRFYKEHSINVVVPEDSRICQDIIIPPGEEGEAIHNQVVNIEIIRRPSRRMSALGKVLEILGEPMDPGMEIDVALRNFEIPHEWPEAVEEQVSGLEEEVSDTQKAGRVDLRHLPLVTIDGEDARDFDDAVFCETKPSGGWRLYVAIADVSTYVPFGSPLDSEALNRGNSVYFPEQVVPMLPEILSNGLCSLNPHVDRLCLVCEVTVSAAGKLSGYKFYEAVMNSKQRFTYTQVAGLLDGDESLVAEFAEFMPHIVNLYEMYKVLQSKRVERGAIEFDTVETRFVFNEQRKIERIVPVMRNDAHRIIEECMILANISAAKFIEKHEYSALFRVHDAPDEEKLSYFRAFLGLLGIESGISNSPTPIELTELLSRLTDRADIELIQVMLLRSMKQATYQADNIGHFGLALPAYAHFTSPIRRYPDLVLHRSIKAILVSQNQTPTGSHRYLPEEMDALGEQCSMTERRADDATRDVADWLKCEYMHHHVGDVFDGVISTVTNFGMFVRLNGIYIDGLVHVSTLRDDYYHFDQEQNLLVGEGSRKVYKMGEPVTIQVMSVNLEQRKIDFMLFDSKTQKSDHKKKTKKKSKKSKSQGKSKESKKKSNSQNPFAKFKDKKPKTGSKTKKSSKASKPKKGKKKK